MTMVPAAGLHSKCPSFSLMHFLSVGSPLMSGSTNRSENAPIFVGSEAAVWAETRAGAGPHRAEKLFGTKQIVTATATGKERVAYERWCERTRLLGGALDVLEVAGDGRVGTFAWNTSRHLELYFAVPSTGRVLHTLNIRLFP